MVVWIILSMNSQIKASWKRLSDFVRCKPFEVSTHFGYSSVEVNILVVLLTKPKSAFSKLSNNESAHQLVSMEPLNL